MPRNEAEVDLVVDVSRALPDLERNLTRIVNQAERNADPVDLQTRVDTVQSLRQLDTQLSAVIDQVQGRIDPVEVDVLLQQREAVRTLSRQVDQVVNTTTRTIDPVTIQGVLDSPETLATVRRQLDSVVARVQATAPEIELEVDIDPDRLQAVQRSLDRLGQGARSAAGSLGPLAARAGAVGVALGGVMQILPAAVTTLSEVGPAAAVATQGLLAVRLAAATVQVAMIGVQEAVEAAFDPETTPEELEEALKRLAPEARKTVEALAGMRGELSRIQQGVQNRFFRNFDDTLRDLARTTGPLAERALNSVADTLNKMAQGAATAAQGLANDGTLGKAIDGATRGLENLSFVPARVTTAIGQLAAASAPAFDRITRKVDQVSADITTKLAGAFRSGELEKSIDAAISELGQLLRIIRNFGGVASNIFRGLNQDGNGLFDILEKISGSFRKLTASKEFQDILGELSSTLNTLVENALPLVQKAFEELAPVIQELAPVVREFVKEIGPELIPVLEELGPVLLDIAKIIKEQLPLAIEVTKVALRTLTIAFQAVHFILNNIILPVVRLVARVFQSELFTAIADVSRKITSKIGELATTFERWRSRTEGAIRAVIGAGDRFVTGIRNGFINGTVRLVTSLVERFQRFVGEVTAVFTGLPGVMLSIGRNIVQGLINGIQSQLGRLLGIARSIASTVKDTIANALDINSPSRVTYEQGSDTGEGFILGVARWIPQVAAVAEELAMAVPGAVEPQFALPRTDPVAPVVNVFIGNEQLTGRMDERIARNNVMRDRLFKQGVRP